MHNAFASLLVLPLAIMPATAATAAPTTNQRVTIIFVGDRPGLTTATGEITASGTAEEASVIQPDGTFTGTLTFHFRDGDINAPFVGAITSLTFNPSNCIGTFTTSGNFHVANGTGDFVGITGQGTFAERGAFLRERTLAGCSSNEIFRVLKTEASGNLEL
jgi:hypothetical protein